MRCTFSDSFGKQCRYKEPDVELYCWRHDVNKPVILFIKNGDGYDFMEMREGLSKEEAERYIEAGVALDFEDDQVEKWHREYLIDELNNYLALLVHNLRTWKKEGNVEALRNFFAAGSTREKGIAVIRDEKVLSDEEKDYFLKIIGEMKDKDFRRKSRYGR